ncbi:MAG: hypothetical protein C0608_07575 [Deltaproteobacteria bacterium]|nr:MAG: hypothetical protein C0608_07575 [Deltaproteobacteria bacterium]
MSRSGALKTFILLTVALLYTSSALAVPEAVLWPKWQNYKAGSEVRVDNSRWATFLQRYLVTDHPSGINRVKYGEVSGNDRRELEVYVKMLAETDPFGLSRLEQMAYWINLYNAFTVKLIIDNYPVKSILNIKPDKGWTTFGPWDEKYLKVAGEPISLNDIEHRILRPIFKDPRIHYALNCASIGCPNLQPVPYDEENIEELLDKGANEYVNSNRGAHFDGARLVLSSIYGWYSEDFGGSKEAVLSHLMKYADKKLHRRLYGYNLRINYEYDWELNAP